MTQIYPRIKVQEHTGINSIQYCRGSVASVVVLQQ